MSRKPDLPYDELAQRYAKAQRRVLELEHLLMKYVAQDRSNAARREMHLGQPLLDLAAGREPAETAEEGQAEQKDEDEEPQAASARKKKKLKGGRKKLPAHLPRETKEYAIDPARDLPGYAPEHGFQVIDYDTCEELVLPRPEPKVIVHKRPVVLYRTLDGETRLATVGGLSKVFPKCAASPSVLARIAVDRLHYHLTLYRIERFFAEHGCPLARSTLAYWMIWLGKLLQPIARAQEWEILKSFKLHADDTEVRVLAPEQAERVRVWVLIGDGAAGRELVFKYTEARTSAAVQRILGAYAGYLQVDACGVYDALYEDGRRMEVGCWSHVLRKAEDVALVDSRAKPLLRMIRDLYDVEDAARGLKPEVRWVLRELASRPVLARIKTWVGEQRAAEFLESSFKKVLNYIVNQWTALQRFLEDGRLSVDNNVAESEFHVFGVGRRNYLFWGSREGLESGLALFGLIRSCVANQIDPYLYLEDVIQRVATTETPARLLIPSKWKNLPPLASEKSPSQAPVSANHARTG